MKQYIADPSRSEVGIFNGSSISQIYSLTILIPFNSINHPHSVRPEPGRAGTNRKWLKLVPVGFIQ